MKRGKIVDENINLKFPSMIWGGFHGREIRITGWAGVEVYFACFANL